MCLGKKVLSNGNDIKSKYFFDLKCYFYRVVSVSLGVLVITFLPASNLLIRVGFVVAERVLYLPSAGYCLLIALGVNRVMQFSNKIVRLFYF